MMQYGFQRLVLLGSAGYQRAELPLDDAVSLIAPNNTGKTSLINALQFLLIIDRRRMDFGAHDFDKTRRFYFPDNSAYILLEVSLPQTGTVVFGCVGKGVSHDYEYIAYRGELNVEDFREPQGTLVQQPQLISHLASRGRTVYRYTASEFSNLIYGGSRGRRSAEPDFTVFKLEHSSDAQAFQRVLTRTLRLDRLNSADVKEYLLQIFKRDLPDANIDFKQEWDKAFHEVNADRAQYQAAVSQLQPIGDLERAWEQRLQLRGKLIEWRPRIDQGLSHWQGHYQAQEAHWLESARQLKDEQSRQLDSDRQLTAQGFELRGQRTRLQADEQRQAELSQQLALVKDRHVLEQQLTAAASELDRHTALMEQTSGRSVTVLERELDKRQRELQQLEQQRQSLDDNLYRRLAEHLSAVELDSLNRLLSAQTMTLAPDHFQLDPAPLRTMLTTAAPDRLALPGLSLSLAALQPQHQQLTAGELDEQLVDSRRQLESLQQQLAMARAFEQAQQRKHELQQIKDQCSQSLADYDQLQVLLGDAAQRQQQLQQLGAQLAQIEQALADTQQRAERLRNQLDDVHRQQRALNDAHQTIERLRNQRADQADEFSYLNELPHHPWLGEPEWALDQLAERLQSYQRDCQQLQQLNRDLRAGLAELHSHGLTKYQYSDTPDLELKRIIEFSHQLPQEQEALEKKARSAVVNVTASLRELRDGLWAFQGKMREFNRLIGHRQLSDLKTFKIEAEDETHLVEAIDTLIDKAEHVESGDSFELFNQSSVLDDDALDRAKQTLIDEGNARQGLKVADLFRLVFVVGKVDQTPESFQDIDSAASNGTVLMAKLVTGLAMLHLMQDKRHNLHAICYLDEALALDGRNQASLIATAHEFGFSLIFASPAPLTTVRYCVPIHHHNGWNHISRDSWQILESLADTPAAARS